MKNVPFAGPWADPYSPATDPSSPVATGLSPFGLAIMVLSIAGILVLVVCCYAAVLRSGHDQRRS
ncbi:MAG: hypothetical protein IT457_08080 [Planctomycetes bacterium]|nr:hypothetical protein [Planctomycetota bacterium]